MKVAGCLKTDMSTVKDDNDSDGDWVDGSPKNKGRETAGGDY